MHLRDTATNTVKSYPLHHDAELGLELLGHAMDFEMAAVPTNCREDDDVQTNSDVLALGVETVERYLGSLLLFAEKYLERPAKRRMQKIQKNIFKKEK